MVGGGNPPRPGEVTLANHGVLFLDELPEFNRATLEALRGPLEDRCVWISRSGHRMCFPSSFSLVCAMNPCPCGYLSDPSRQCRCTQRQVEMYRHRLSGPLLDRIDMHVSLNPVDPAKLDGARSGEASHTVRARVMAARCRQLQRAGERGVATTNASAGIEEFGESMQLSQRVRERLVSLSRSLRLSARGWFRVIRVARTIADLAGVESIDTDHITEAIGYRVQNNEGV